MPGGAHEYMKAWDPEEDHIIMEMVAAEGPKWKQIVKCLPGRTVSSVRNRWQRIEKGRKLRENGEELKNRCHACGQPKRGHICSAKVRGGPQVDLPNVPVDGGEVVALPTSGGGPSRIGAISSAAALGYAGPSPGSAGAGQPPLRRTRSGSKLVSDEDRAARGGVQFNVDVAAAGSSFAPPNLGRTNTSFFKDLVSSDLFSPGSKELMQAWVDSPDNVPLSVSAAAHDPLAPPSLRRVASAKREDEDGMGPPKLTRSVTSYIREMAGDEGYTGGSLSGASPLVPGSQQRAPMPSAARQGTSALLSSLGMGGSSGAPPQLLSREASVPNLGRSVSSFVRDFIDTSAELEAPPPSAVPPPLAATLSTGSLSDFLK